MNYNEDLELKFNTPILVALNKKIEDKNAAKIVHEKSIFNAVRSFSSWCDDHKYHIQCTFEMLKKWAAAYDDHHKIYEIINGHDFYVCGKFHALGREIYEDSSMNSEFYGILDSGKAVSIIRGGVSPTTINYDLFDLYEYTSLIDTTFLYGLAKEYWEKNDINAEFEKFKRDFEDLDKAVKDYLIKELELDAKKEALW